MLKADGYDIRIDHYRLSEAEMRLAKGCTPGGWVSAAPHAVKSVTELRAEGKTIAPCGGTTVAEVYAADVDGEPLATGIAVCSPHDNFNKKIGRAIATGRALKELGRKTGQ